MKSKHKHLGLIIAIVVIVVVIVILQNPFRESAIIGESTSGDLETIGTKPGNKAPDFVLKNLKGEDIRLSDLKGKNIIVNFWATWCPFCVDEMPDFQRAADENENLVVLGVNLQETNIDLITRFVNDLGVSYPILLDPDADVKNRYGVFTQPVTFFINEDRIIMESKFGPMTSEQIDEKVALLVSDKMEERKTSNTDPDDSRIQTLEDGTRFIVHPDELLSGGPPKDGIPSIDNPKFISVEEADSFLDDDDIVIALELDGVQRAYPFQILVWHEIVNDNLNGKPVLVTYCPLCGTGIVYDRLINGGAIEFGVSGKLYNSDLVMYDRKTDSYWYQITGEAIVGDFTGHELKVIESDVIQWGDFKNAFPDAEVLSRDTGHFRSYGIDPYGDYYTSSRTLFPVENQDGRLHPKAVVYGIEIDGNSMAYPDLAIGKGESIIDDFNGVKIEFGKDVNSRITIKNLDTGKELVPIRGFWFAWVAAHPDTGLYT